MTYANRGCQDQPAQDLICAFFVRIFILHLVMLFKGDLVQPGDFSHILKGRKLL